MLRSGDYFCKKRSIPDVCLAFTKPQDKKQIQYKSQLFCNQSIYPTQGMKVLHILHRQVNDPYLFILVLKTPNDSEFFNS